MIDPLDGGSSHNQLLESIEPVELFTKHSEQLGPSLIENQARQGKLSKVCGSESFSHGLGGRQLADLHH